MSDTNTNSNNSTSTRHLIDEEARARYPGAVLSLQLSKEGRYYFEHVETSNGSVEIGPRDVLKLQLYHSHSGRHAFLIFKHDGRWVIVEAYSKTGDDLWLGMSPVGSP